MPVTNGDTSVSSPVVSGSVAWLFLRDFMQFVETSVKPGPHLNLIVGPNGSGKSAIVSAICLGLDGTPSTLGRATDIREFVRKGAQKAVIEIALNNEDDPDRPHVIERTINLDGRSSWKINKKATSAKHVKALTNELHIQTKNLCQFLPQDKVLQFSKMNSRQLLSKTIEAVGEEQLREDHQELIRRQEEENIILDKQDERKKQRTEIENKITAIESDVQHYKEKKQLERKIKLFQKRRQWIVYENAKKDLKAARDSLKRESDFYDEEKKKQDPIRTRRRELQRKINECNTNIKKHFGILKELTTQCKSYAVGIEDLDESMDNLDEEIKDLASKEAEQKAELGVKERQLADLQQQLEEAKADHSTQSLQPQKTQAEKSLLRHQEAVRNIDIDRNTNKYDLQAAKKRADMVDSQIAALKDIHKQKLQVLKRLNSDAYKAAAWLQENRDKFKHPVYFPILYVLDLKNSQDAVYLENTIAIRDFLAFVAEDKEDMNKFLNIARDELGYRISVLHAGAGSFDKEDATTREINEAVKKLPGFKNFACDLFTAPEAVKKYLNVQYQLQHLPLFTVDAQEHLDKFVQKFKVKVFFVDNQRYQTKKSHYSDSLSTSVTVALPKKLLELSVDKDKERSLTQERQGLTNELERLRTHGEKLSMEHNDARKKVEETRQELKVLREKIEAKQYLTQKVKLKKEEIAAFKERCKQNSTDHQRIRLEAKKDEYADQAITLAEKLQTKMYENIRSTEERNRERYKLYLLGAQNDYLKGQLDEMEKDITGIKDRVDQAQREFQRVGDEMRTYEVDAKSGMKELNLTPDALAEECAKQNIPPTIDMISKAVDDMTREIACMQGLDPDVITRYEKLTREAKELTALILRDDRDKNARREKIEDLKARWLKDVQILADRISVNFGRLFADMGFAGAVELHEGNTEYDFSHYGLNILVKYRSNVDMQKLDTHTQSGGERSVATALYMLALQDLTVVPFRCVDEINQGMDVTNERKVFDLLVRTSCHESSAQYFLLTPKLLPGLRYHDNVTVLVVHSGEDMCHHSEWDMNKFVEAARRLSKL